MKVRLVLKDAKTVDGQVYPAGTAILVGEIPEGITMNRVKQLLATNRAEWLEEMEETEDHTEEALEMEDAAAAGLLAPRRRRRSAS